MVGWVDLILIDEIGTQIEINVYHIVKANAAISTATVSALKVSETVVVPN